MSLKNCKEKKKLKNQISAVFHPADLVQLGKVCKLLLRARWWLNSFQNAEEKPLYNQVKMIYAFPVKYRDQFKWIHIIILFAVVKSSLI